MLLWLYTPIKRNKSMQKYLLALRPTRWLKNLLVLVPIVFSAKFLDLGSLSRTLLAVVLFSLTASAAYLMNDLFDREKDLAFHTKKLRPIAAKELNVTPVIVLAFILGILGIVGGFFVEPMLGLVLLGYLVLTLWYSAWLQNIAVLDIVALALMTTLRVVAGAVVVGISPSAELLFAASALGILLATAERLKDKRSIVAGVDTPLVVSTFSSRFLETSLVASAGLFFLSYVLLSLSSSETALVKDNSLFYSSILIFFVAFRFAYVHLGEPDKAPKKDMALITGILVYCILIVTVFYLVA